MQLYLSLLLTVTPADLKALHVHMEAEDKRTAQLFRDGNFAEALKVRQALLLELQTKLKDVPVKEQQAAYLASSVDVAKSTIAELEPLVALSAKSATDAQAAGKLLLALLHPTRVAFTAAKLGDPVPQKLIASIRTLDARAAKLLGPRKVRVAVTGRALDDKARAHFATQLIATLGALGLRASTDAGGEPFEVSLQLDGPESAHLYGDTNNVCRLRAVAKWPAGGLPHLNLTTYGFGDEEDDDDCFKQRVAESVALAGEQILRTALRLPLAANSQKEDGSVTPF